MNQDSTPKDKRALREARLAQALRENLRRRKQQARAQKQPQPQPSKPERAPPG